MTDEEKIEKLQADVDRLNVGLGYIHINLELGHYSKALEVAILLAKGGDIRDVEDEYAIQYAKDKSNACPHGFVDFDVCPDCRH